MGNPGRLQGSERFQSGSRKSGIFAKSFTYLGAGLILIFGVLPIQVLAQQSMPSNQSESSVQLLQPPSDASVKNSLRQDAL